jgi:predicted RNA-binding protein
MGVFAWHNRIMRWPWTGIEEELRLMRRQIEDGNVRYERLIEENHRFTTECIMDMRRWSERKDRELDSRLEEIVAEQRAGREALFRMMDRLGPGPDAASA